jgi:hypothetical protein
MNKQQAQLLLQEIDRILEEATAGGKKPSAKVIRLIEEISNDLQVIQQKEKKALDQALLDKIDKLTEVTGLTEKSQDIIQAIRDIKLVVPAPQVSVAPPEVKVNVEPTKVTIPPIRVPQASSPTVIVPDEVTVRKPSWLPSLSPLVDALNEIKTFIANIKIPRSAKEPIAVRLSDGEKFYRAGGGIGGGGGAIFPFAKSDGNVKQALVDDAGVQQVRSLNGIVTEEHDFVSLGWTGSNLTSVIYRINGAGGDVVATLSLTYDGSNNLTSVTKVV